MAMGGDQPTPELQNRNRLHARNWVLMGQEIGLGKRVLLGDAQKRTGFVGGRLGLLVRSDGEILVDRRGRSHFCWQGGEVNQN